jgi:hypothetical protein
MKIDYSKEAARLRAEGINVIIALGHSGLEKDKTIAARCPEIDLIIGGHCERLKCFFSSRKRLMTMARRLCSAFRFSSHVPIQRKSTEQRAPRG